MRVRGDSDGGLLDFGVRPNVSHSTASPRLVSIAGSASWQYYC